MPTDVEHVQKYKHNKCFIKSGINSSKGEVFDDWVVVANFYAALHLVEAVLYKECKEKIDISNHDERCRLLEEYPRVFNHECRRSHNYLKHLAHKARYKALSSTTVKDARQAQEYLESIELELRPYINV